MKKRYLIILVAIIIIAIILALIMADGTITSKDRTTLNISSQSPITVDELAESIETNDYYKGYNESTLKWLKTQRGYVFTGENEYVIMNSFDMSKLPIEDATDVYINLYFSCEVSQRKQLGDNLKDIVVVNNVEFIRSEIHYMEV